MARSVYYFTDSSLLGGAEEALLLLIEHLDRSRWEPTLLYNLSPGTERLADRARELGVLVRPVPPLPLGLLGARRTPRFARDLVRARPAVFHAHLSWPLAAKYPLAAALLARVPAVVATFHLFPPGPISRSALLQAGALGVGVGRAIAVSEAIAVSLREVFHWPSAKIELIRNGVPLERLQQRSDPELRKELTGSDDDVLFLTTARLDPQKGLDVLLRSAVFVSGARFAIAGEGPERARLERDVETLGLGDRVRLLGHREDIPALLAVADAFVLPSRFEGTPLALLEAMAAGKPVVATAISGTDELVADGECGLLVRADDPSALAAGLRRIVAEPELRERLGAAARRRAKNAFSAAVSTERVTAVYDDLLRRSRSQ
jgi:glycosyltransferase involved in cell wall biosynthesis